MFKSKDLTSTSLLKNVAASPRRIGDLAAGSRGREAAIATSPDEAAKIEAVALENRLAMDASVEANIGAMQGSSALSRMETPETKMREEATTGGDHVLRIEKGLRFSGEISGCHALHVAGEVILGQAEFTHLLIAAGGKLMGDISCAQAEIAGDFNGSLVVSGLLHCHGSAVMRGQIAYGQLSVERGAQLQAQVKPQDVAGADAAA